jgi:hypothetical protein
VQSRGRRTDPGFECRLGAAQGSRRALDGRDLAFEVFAIGGGEQTGTIGIGGRARAAVKGGRIARRRNGLAAAVASGKR